MKAAVVVLALFAVVAFADNCTDSSYASGAVSKVVGLTTPFSGLTTAPQINTALQALGGVVSATTSSWVQNVYVGLSNSDTYLIKNCRRQDGANFFCGNTTQYLAYVRNTAYFGDNFRHVFRLNDLSNIDITTGVLGTELSEYNTTGRFWFNQGNNVWSALQQYAAGGNGKTYTQTFTGGVAAADRSTQEPCGQCFSDSWAVAAVNALATTDLTSFRGVTQATGFQAIATTLQNLMKNIGGGEQVAAYVAFANDDSYTVKNCNVSANRATTPECGTNRSWLFYARNAAALGNTSRLVYELTDAGNLLSSVVFSASAPYYPTQRPFYLTQNGWSDAYQFASSTITGNTYTAAFNGGVLAADRVLDEPCQRVTPGTVSNGGASATCAPSKTSAASASASVLAALSVAALFFVAL